MGVIVNAVKGMDDLRGALGESTVYGVGMLNGQTEGALDKFGQQFVANLDIGSKTCPIINEIRNSAQGMV